MLRLIVAISTFVLKIVAIDNGFVFDSIVSTSDEQLKLRIKYQGSVAKKYEELTLWDTAIVTLERTNEVGRLQIKPENLAYFEIPAEAIPLGFDVHNLNMSNPVTFQANFPQDQDELFFLEFFDLKGGIILRMDSFELFDKYLAWHQMVGDDNVYGFGEHQAAKFKRSFDESRPQPYLIWNRDNPIHQDLFFFENGSLFTKNTKKVMKNFWNTEQILSKKPNLTGHS